MLGPGLIAFGLDDLLSVHERAGGWIARNADVLPLFTNHADDFITPGYGAAGLAVLALFRHALFAVRASSALLVAGVVAAGLMLATDAYGHGVMTTLEFPAQVTAVAMLLPAQLTRYREVRAGTARPRPATEAPAEGTDAAREPALGALAMGGDGG